MPTYHLSLILSPGGKGTVVCTLEEKITKNNQSLIKKIL